VQEVDTAWTQAIQKMEKYMRKLEKVKRRLGKIKATAEVQGPKPERLIHRFEKYTAKLEIVHAELKGLVGMNASAN
jgi:DNA integrity scanning protein DisA with diadenylate cyclase activity